MKRLPHLFAALSAAACAGSPAPATHVAPAVAAAPASSPRPSVPLRYAVGTGHYRLDTHSHVEQDAMGQTTAADVGTGMLLTVAVADTEPNLRVTITIDSLGITSSMGGPDSAQLAAARGTSVRLLASRQGTTLSMMPPDSASPVGAQVAAGLGDFLPELPAQPADSGTIWSDSSTRTTPSQGLAVTVRTTRRHTVLGWETHDGTRALHLVTTAAYTVSGSGQAQGQEMDVTGGGQRVSDAFVSADGVYLGGTFTDSSLVNASLVAMGMVVPMRSKTRSTITRLP